MPKHLSLLAPAIAIVLSACGGGGSSTAPLPPPPSITLAAVSTVPLADGKPVNLTATVSSADTVTWQLPVGSPGSLSASSGASISYVPPAGGITTATPIVITASAGGASKAIRLTLYPDPGIAGLRHVAGSLGGAGNLDGAGPAARFSNITDLATDSAGNTYVADNSDRHAIRKVSADGVVTTLASGESGDADGGPGVAKFGFIAAIAAGSNGGVLFLDVGNGTALRQLTPDGKVTTLVRHALLDGAKALAAGPGNTAYAMRSQSIVVASAGTANVLAGGDTSNTSVDGQGGAASFADLSGMARDTDGNLLLLQPDRLRKVTPAGAVTTYATIPQGTLNMYANMASLTLDANGKPLVLMRDATSLETMRYAIMRFSAPGQPETLLQGSFRESPPYDRYRTAPRHIRMAKDKFLLARSSDIRLWQDGTVQPFAGLADDSLADIDGPGAAARFAGPHALAADGAGNIYVSDYPGSYAIASLPFKEGGLYLRKVAPDGAVSTLVARQDFGIVRSIVADLAGNVYISEILATTSRIQPRGGAVYKLTPDGKLALLAGLAARSGGSEAQADGAGSAARFTLPVLEGLDPDGNLYVRDDINIRKIAPDGNVSTIAALPAGIGAAPDGFKYVADNGVIYRITATGQERVAGVPNVIGTVPGALPGSLSRHVVLAPAGPYSFALISGSAILKLVLPH